VSQLPNFAFSVAMAYFQFDEDPDSEKKLTANDLLQKALIMFPGVILPLLDKCSVQPDSRVSTHPFFTTKAIMRYDIAAAGSFILSSSKIRLTTLHA
jgi:hypothetical protein